MIGSKFNYKTNLFDYYRVPDSVGDITTPAYGHRRLRGNGNKIGYVAESLAAPLPPDLEKIGSGKAPQGMVFSEFSELQGASPEAIVALGTLGLIINLTVLGFAAYGVHTWWNK